MRPDSILFSFRIHGILVCDKPSYFHGFINDSLAAYGLSDEVKSEEIITLHDGYKHPRYDQNLPEQLGK